MARCFVIGPIGDRLAPVGSPSRQTWEEALAVFEDVIKPACQANDLDPIRADGIAIPGEITDQIFRHLFEDEVVIADVSGGNANVMYELGLRHTRNLLTVQIGEYGQLPFDVSSVRTIMFSRSDRGLIDARNELSRALRVGLAEGGDAVTATKVWLAAGGLDLSDSTGDVTETDAQETEQQEIDPLDEDGFIERMVKIEQVFPAMTETVEGIGEILESLGDDAQKMSAEFELLNETNAPTQRRLAIMARYGESLSEPSERLTELTSSFVQSMEEADSTMRGLLRDLTENPQLLESKDSQEFLSTVGSMAASTREGMESLNEFGTLVGGLGSLSKVLRKPGKRMQDAIRSMAKAAAVVDEWEAGAARLISRPPATGGEALPPEGAGTTP
ncbi:hypothetical protein ASE12_19420 [Aeromicrobium sp. Root236]|uniref:hypothetical protein n=1 Tax=Aeromicrobium sp. Root236 TaxID=1736498 RepID=UPI0006FB7C5B|nr:hypothetical protein [Aeromicrobium sp. Root236]KRC66748.1 hypothetical protein ASE12_19420 [Aeromicrobium sp. Root236]